MSNETTVKAIIDNLEAILTTTIGWKLEDLSTDAEARTITACQLLYNAETFEDTFGEHPQYNEIDFQILVERTHKTPATRRELAVEYVHKLRTYVTVTTVNVGSLATSQLVSWVAHTGAKIDSDNSTIRISYAIKIRYRET
jgi:hypothetical protein